MLLPSGQIRILLVDDRPIEREGIRVCLAAEPQFEIVAEAADAERALAEARECFPDVVVVDEELTRLNGLAATARLRRELPALRVLVLTAHDHPDHLTEIIRSGASGCVRKDVMPEDLRRAVARVATGEPYFGLTETIRYLRRYRSASPCEVAEPVHALTTREQEVLELIGLGLSNRQIAERLEVALRTIETHRERIMRKLDIHDGGSLRAYAGAHKLLASGTAAG